jgi:2'-5' RNA ligase
MSPLPVRLADRWGNPDRVSYDNSVCWHLLLGSNPAARSVAAEAARRLSGFPGLRMTPPEWLHITVMRVCDARDATGERIGAMLAAARDALTGVPPVTATLGRIFYHPEAIALGIDARGTLAPLLTAARAAAREMPGADADRGADSDVGWSPHLTLCYSTADQPAAPVIAALGRDFPPAQLSIAEMSLVVQRGAEENWDWEVVGAVRMLGGAGVSRRERPA